MIGPNKDENVGNGSHHPLVILVVISFSGYQVIFPARDVHFIGISTAMFARPRLRDGRL